MKTALVLGVVVGALAGPCLAQTYGQPRSHIGGTPAYVSPRLPLGYAALGQGHAVHTAGTGSGGYIAPRLDYGRGARIEIDAPPVAVNPTIVYVVIPDIRVSPSPVIVEPPQVYFVPDSPASDD